MRKPSLTIIECNEAYFPFVKSLRKELSGVRVLKESSEVDRRIAATSDYIKSNVLFNETALNNNADYSSFMTNLLDYNKDNESKEASTVLSGFARFAVKSFSKVNIA